MTTSLPKTLFTAGITAATVLALGAPASAAPATTTLVSAKAVLDRVHDVPNTAWGIDPATHQVVVTISDAAHGTGMAKLREAIASLGSSVRVKHTAKPLTTQV